MKPVQRTIDNPPGGVLFWLIVALELLTFAIVFGIIAHYRNANPVEFVAGRAALSLSTGLALTLVLVSSGAMVARGVHEVRRALYVEGRWWFWGAIGLGTLFVVLKVRDYLHLGGQGHALDSSNFWTAYYLATGFHLAHVVVGLGLLIVMAIRLGRVRFDDEETSVAGVALFWHMCDVVWFFLFPLFFAG